MNQHAQHVQHVDAQLLSLALGELPEEAAAAAEAHLGTCPRCQAEDRAVTEAIHAQPLSLPRVAPPPALRARLLAAVDAAPPLLQRLARLFDIALTEAQRIYDAIRDPAAWVAPLPGVRLMHLTGGPATAGADCGLVHIAAGERFPRHRHRGLETTLVLRGSYRDGDAVVSEGQEVRCEAGTEHDMVALGDLLYAVTVVRGVEILEGDVQVTG